jgi:Type II/IV secretion system protein
MSTRKVTERPDRDRKLFQILIRKLEKNGLARRGDATAYMQSHTPLPLKGTPTQGSKRTVTASLDMFLRRIRGKQGYRRDDSQRRCTTLDYGDSLKIGTKDESDCRVQVSSCYRGKAWSFTVRRKVNDERPAEKTLQEWLKDLRNNHSYKNGYEPSLAHAFKKGDLSLASIDEICESLLELFDLDGTTDPHPSGLLLITGATNCGKSKIAKGLIFKYLTSGNLNVTDRNRHLVTYEDPIEDWFFPGRLLLDAEFRKNRRIDYTPREKGLDCNEFEECTRAALRQTPSVFFAGELRDPQDLAEAVYFGGTGHLIVATAHAGSVIEAADKILSAVKATNSFERAIQVPKIRGIVHLRPMKTKFQVIPEKEQAIKLEASMFVPSVYRRCQPGMQSFIADGLSALIPHCPQGDQQEYRRYGSLGRQFLVRHILRRRLNKEDPNEADIKPPIPAPGIKLPLIWKKCWEEIRSFHASFGVQNPHKPKIEPGDEKDNASSSPLWVQCVQDDLKGLR